MAQLSDEALQEITNYVEVQGLAWAKEFIAGRKAWMEKQGIKASGDLILSLEEQVISTIEGAARTRLEIAFSTHGRYLDMKRLNVPRGGSEFIDNLAAWIEDKGFRGKWTSKFMRKRGLVNEPPNILQMMAWGIAKNRSKKYRRRQWYNKPKSASITDLYNRVAANMPDLVAKQIKEAFQTN